MGPCLCGDPACGRCFPGATDLFCCTVCEWEGQRHELESERGFDLCPECGEDAELEEAERIVDIEVDRGPMHEASEDDYDRWATDYDGLNGVPESEDDR